MTLRTYGQCNCSLALTILCPNALSRYKLGDLDLSVSIIGLYTSSNSCLGSGNFCFKTNTISKNREAPKVYGSAQDKKAKG